jgi:hypothetical protein
MAGFWNGLAKCAMIQHMPAAKPVRLKRPMSFDEAMQRLVRLSPPPSGKKAKRKVGQKKQR